VTQPVRQLLIVTLLLALSLPGLCQDKGKRKAAESPRLTTRKNTDGTLSGKWRSPFFTILCRLHLPESGDKRHPVVVYLKNLPTPRLGSLADATLIKGFVDQGMLVIEADY
jgi:hypothetical protein